MEATQKRIYKIVSRYDSSKVLFECEIPDGVPSGLEARHALEKAAAAGSDLSGSNLRGSDLSGSNLRGSDLSGSNLSGCDVSGSNLSGCDVSGAYLQNIKTDFFDVLLRAPAEVAGLRAALIAGKVNGSTYKGDCACLVGTIANVRGVECYGLGNGIRPDSSRPIERWFLAITEGDTPETNQVSKIVVEWLDEFVELLAAATKAQGVAA